MGAQYWRASNKDILYGIKRKMALLGVIFFCTFFSEKHMADKKGYFLYTGKKEVSKENAEAFE